MRTFAPHPAKSALFGQGTFTARLGASQRDKTPFAQNEILILTAQWIRLPINDLPMGSEKCAIALETKVQGVRTQFSAEQ